MFAIRTLAVCFLFSTVAIAAEKAESLYRKTLRSTVQIETSQGTGTGWVVDAEKKWLITAEHVVRQFTRVNVVFPAYRDGRVISNRAFYEERTLRVPGRVIRVDDERDLALIEIDSIPEGVQQLKLAEEAPEPGEDVHAVGCPGRSSALWVYSHGRVRQSAKIRLSDGEPGNGPQVIETQLPLNPGDSGGPLVNNAGELVGVNHALRRDAQLVTLSIEVGEIRQFLKAKGSDRKTQLEQRLKQARQHMEDKKWDEAEESFRSALKLDERNLEAWHRLAWIYNEKREFEKASMAAISALRIDEKCLLAWLELGYAQKELKNWERARIALTKAIECDPKNETAQEYMKEVREALEDEAPVKK